MSDTENESLKGRVVLVAGASSGMGRAIASATADAGASLVLAARSADALGQIANTARCTSRKPLVVPTDMTDLAAVEHLVKRTVDEYGRIDMVVNTVGTNIPRRTIGELTSSSWAEMLAVNLTSAFNLTHAVIPILRNQGDGLIIYISSSAAKKPDRSGIAYQASKAGVAALAHGTMEEERQHGIRTTVVFPGLTDTPLILKRPTPPPADVVALALQPEDVAAACLFVMRLPARAHVPELVVYPSRP